MMDLKKKKKNNRILMNEYVIQKGTTATRVYLSIRATSPRTGFHRVSNQSPSVLPHSPHHQIIHFP